MRYSFPWRIATSRNRPQRIRTPAFSTESGDVHSAAGLPKQKNSTTPNRTPACQPKASDVHFSNDLSSQAKKKPPQSVARYKADWGAHKVRSEMPDTGQHTAIADPVDESFLVCQLPKSCMDWRRCRSRGGQFPCAHNRMVSGCVQRLGIFWR